MLELSLSSGAGGGILAHTHGRVALVDLANFALLAVVVQAGICEKSTEEVLQSVSQKKSSCVKH